jgi:hypothetical protein
MNYNGQTVTGQMFSYPKDGVGYDSLTNFWSVTSNGVTFIASRYIMQDGSVSTTTLGGTLPASMSPGQTINGMTLLGFETVGVGDKIFYNTCHFKVSGTGANSDSENWVAPGYGQIRIIYPNNTLLEYESGL